jgi:hypothetical protein
LGAERSNSPLKGFVAGTTSPFNAIPYGGFISLLHPLHSEELSSNRLDLIPTLVCLV